MSTTTPSARSSTSTSLRVSTAFSRSEPPGRGFPSVWTSGVASRISSCRRRRSASNTIVLAAHAAEVGADAVVVIGPPYFKLDEKAQYAHFFSAATACAPLPFYVYEFATTTGYAIAPAVLERLHEDVANVVGLKVSDTPFEAFEKYLLPGFDIFVGPEALIADGMARGARGAVSALASALPREVAAVVRDPTAEGAARLGELRSFVERFPRQAALKRLLALQGLPVREDVRAPLRALTADERDELDAWAESVLAPGVAQQ
jgi:dihydrodipicolinate synthase/N-acetylneuraminate lyase